MNGAEVKEGRRMSRDRIVERQSKNIIVSRLTIVLSICVPIAIVVFFDTTSLSFTGAGGKSLGKRGYSKDHRPDLMQMIVGVVIDAEGRPVCSEMWPGNTADVTVLVPVIDRLRSRFAIGRVC